MVNGSLSDKRIHLPFTIHQHSYDPRITRNDTKESELNQTRADAAWPPQRRLIQCKLWASLSRAHGTSALQIVPDFVVSFVRLINESSCINVEFEGCRL